MSARLWPLRHALPGFALLCVSAALAFPPYFTEHTGIGLFAAPLALASAFVGWLLTTRRPDNPIGWLFSAWSAGVGLTVFAGQYVDRAAYVHPGSLPLADWVAWASTVMWHPGFGMFALVLLLFPTGRALSARWRRVVVLIAAWYAALGAVVAAYPEIVVVDWFSYLRPPFSTPGRAFGQHAYDVLLTGNLFLLLLAVVSLVVRYRRSDETQRYQIKWFVWPVASALVVIFASFFVLPDGRMFPFLLPVIPLAAAVAILRYRLYDIDRVISRSLSYALLTAGVVCVYVAVVSAFSATLRGSSTVAVAAATLAAAAVANPLRRRLQTAVDRRFNRERYDAGRLVERFAGGLRDSVDPAWVEHQLLDVTGRAVQPSTISLWQARPAP